MGVDYHSPFEASHFYHVFNRGNNKENLFQEEDNFYFFLNKWRDYLDQYVNVWAYCLMPNHFHFVVQIKGSEELAKVSKGLTDFENLSSLISNQFSKLFNSYTKSFNKAYNRTGSLFQKRFKRIKIDSQNYLITLIHYIHHNPIHHGFAVNYTDWPYSSFSAILSETPTKVKRNEVLRLFGGKKEFIVAHEAEKDYKKIKHLIVE